MRVVVVAMLAIGAALNGPVARAATSAVSIAITPSSTTAGSVVDLTASMPVSDPGTISQTIRQIIDPAKTTLTTTSTIIAPEGWTISYSTNPSDPNSYTTTAPTTNAGWAAIRAVQATGSVNSDGGDDSGYQIATGSASKTPESTVPPTVKASGTGDGYDPFWIVRRANANQVDA